MRQRKIAVRNPRTLRRHAALGFEPLEGRALLSGTGTPTTPATAAQVLIQEDYLVFLGRQADPSGLAAWSNLANSGFSQGFISQGIATSPEAFQRDVTLAYKADLGRAPTSTELSNGVAALQRAGGPTDAIQANLLAGSEFFANAGGTNQGYVTALYTTVLGRQADSAGEAGWVNYLNHGGSRSTVAFSFLSSQEHSTTEVTAAYHGILGRAPDTAGQNFWVSFVQSQNGREPQLTQQGLLIFFLNSSENLSRVANATSGSIQTSAQIASGLITTSFLTPGVAQANYSISPNSISWSSSGVATPTGAVSPVAVTVTNMDPFQSLVFKPSIAADNFYPNQIPAAAFTFFDSSGNPLTGPITVAPGQTATFEVAFNPAFVSVDSTTFSNYGADLVLLNSFGRQLTPSITGMNGTVPMNLSFSS